jgi:lysyl-tRNA synthetase class 2
MMAQTEALIRAVAVGVGAAGGLTCGGREVDLTGTWPRISVGHAFERYGSMSAEEALAAGRFDEVLVNEVEPNLGRPRPVFLYDYPAACGALARLKPAAPHLAERFELYIGGVELCNAFTELTDPEEQRSRFEKELETRAAGGKAVTPMPEAFLTALEQMPPAAGNALGVDRLVMLFAGADEIDAVVSFVPEEL